MTYILFCPDFVWAWCVSCSDPDMTAPKWSLSLHFGHLCKLSLGHKAQSLIYYFRTNHEQNFIRIGCGWDDQQQDILIIVCDAWNLEVDLHKLKVWDGCTSCPPSFNNWPSGWICSARFSQTGSSHWISEYLNELVQSFPVHLLLLGPCWSIPLSEHQGQD